MAHDNLALSAVVAAAIAVGAEAMAAGPPPGATSCSGCHAAATITTVIPSLRGLTADQIASAMLAFRAGERDATVMDRIARGFSEPEIAAIAGWLGRQGE